MTKKSQLVEEIQEPQVYPINIISKKSTYVTREATQDKWDRDDTSSDWAVNGIELVPEEHGSADLYAKFPVKINKTYWLVYAIYSTGDSFGRDENGSLEEIEIYEDETMAWDCAREIRKHADMYSAIERSYRLKMKKPKDFDSYTVKVIGGDGKEMEVHTPWNGYFESLSYVEVIPVTVGNRSRRF